MKQLLLTAVVLAMSASAQAACRWATVDGNKQRELCDGAEDVGAVPSVPPVSAIPPLRPIAPLPGLTPSGGRDCRQALVQFGEHAEWREVCQDGDGRLLLPGR